MKPSLMQSEKQSRLLRLVTKIVPAILVFSSSAISLSPAYASSPGPEIIIVSDGRISFAVHGSGGWVCSAEDAFKEIPVLGRGETRMEAEAHAKVAASLRAGRGGDTFFSKITSCERSSSGRGRIIMTSHGSGTTITVHGPSAVQCLSEHSFRRIPMLAKAATQTEAAALAGSACAADAGDSGFFCKTQCQRISAVHVGGADVHVGPVRIRLPRVRL